MIPARSTFSAKFACPVCSFALAELEPRLFSFNNSMGPAPSATAYSGNAGLLRPERVVAHPELSLASGCIRGWDRRKPVLLPAPSPAWLPTTASTSRPLGEPARGHPGDHPTARARTRSPSATSPTVAASRCSRSTPSKASFPTSSGASLKPTPSPCARSWPTSRQPPCPACHGTRLRTEVRYALIGDRNPSEVSRLPLAQCKAFRRPQLGQRAQVADKIVSRSSRLQFDQRRP